MKTMLPTTPFFSTPSTLCLSEANANLCVSIGPNTTVENPAPFQASRTKASWRSCSLSRKSLLKDFSECEAPAVFHADAHSVPEQSEAAQQNAEEWERAQKLDERPWDVQRENPSTGYVTLSRRGIPHDIYRCESAGVYRHYVSDPEAFHAILSQGMLREGWQSAWYVAGNARMIEKDVKGIFVTLPETRAELVGCANACGYVDFQLPKGTALFAVPWYLGAYVFVIPGALASGLIPNPACHVEAAPRAPLRVPIHVVDSSRSKKPIFLHSLPEFIADIGTRPLGEELEALSYQLFTWKELLRKSGFVAMPFIRPSQLLFHGRLHLLSVAYLAVLIAKNEGIRDLSMLRALWYAGVFHDVGRSNRYGACDDPDHALRSAESAAWMLSRHHVDREISELTTALIRDHTSDDEASLPPLSRIFKDADALDRYRFGPEGCEKTFLRTRAAWELASEIKSFYFW